MENSKLTKKNFLESIKKRKEQVNKLKEGQIKIIRDRRNNTNKFKVN